MTRIIEGVFEFQKGVFGEKKTLFEKLGGGQQPLALFITCADSRINPNLITQTEPGELFVLRNAGNFVPPAGSPTSGEAAAIEYAVTALKVRDIMLCGHSHCGAMKGLISPEALTELPLMADWLKLGVASLERAKALVPGGPASELLQAVIEQNILQQIENLQTYSVVRDAVAAGQLRLHAWLYHFESGEVTAYDPAGKKFVPLPRSPHKKLLVPMPPETASEKPRS